MRFTNSSTFWEQISHVFMLVEAIVTSELDMTDDDVIETYRGLWRIEESFRITKSELEARPVYVSREDRINAHFLTCFVSLLLLCQTIG